MSLSVNTNPFHIMPTPQVEDVPGRLWCEERLKEKENERLRLHAEVTSLQHQLDRCRTITAVRLPDWPIS